MTVKIPIRLIVVSKFIEFSWNLAKNCVFSDFQADVIDFFDLRTSKNISRISHKFCSNHSKISKSNFLLVSWTSTSNQNIMLGLVEKAQTFEKDVERILWRKRPFEDSYLVKLHRTAFFWLALQLDVLSDIINLQKSVWFKQKVGNPWTENTHPILQILNHLDNFSQFSKIVFVLVLPPKCVCSQEKQWTLKKHFFWG